MQVIILIPLVSLLILDFIWYEEMKEWQGTVDTNFVRAVERGHEAIAEYNRMKSVNIEMSKQNCVISGSATMVAIVIVLVSL